VLIYFFIYYFTIPVYSKTELFIMMVPRFNCTRALIMVPRFNCTRALISPETWVSGFENKRRVSVGWRMVALLPMQEWIPVFFNLYNKFIHHFEMNT